MSKSKYEVAVNGEVMFKVREGDRRGGYSFNTFENAKAFMVAKAEKEVYDLTTALEDAKFTLEKVKKLKSENIIETY